MELNVQEMIEDMPVVGEGGKAEKLQVFIQEGGKIRYKESQVRCSCKKVSARWKPRSPVEGVPCFAGMGLQEDPRHAQHPLGAACVAFLGPGTQRSGGCGVLLTAAGVNIAFSWLP